MPNWVKNMTDYMAAVKTQADKLKGNAPIESAVSANWQSGVATSGEAGADLVTFGVDGSRKKLPFGRQSYLSYEVAQESFGRNCY